MAKLLGLDIGDVWVGVALSDAVGITCRPYRTIQYDELTLFLYDTLKEENITRVVVGHPVTMKGQASEQTKRVETIFATLQSQFTTINDSPVQWILWDERLTTKRALEIMSSKKKKRSQSQTHSDHALAAAFILQSYLDSSAF